MDESQNITLLEQLESATKPTFEELGHDPELGTITVSAKSRAGDFQCNGAMPAARKARANPKEFVDDLIPRLQHCQHALPRQLLGKSLWFILPRSQESTPHTYGAADEANDRRYTPSRLFQPYRRHVGVRTVRHCGNHDARASG